MHPGLSLAQTSRGAGLLLGRPPTTLSGGGTWVGLQMVHSLANHSDKTRHHQVRQLQAGRMLAVVILLGGNGTWAGLGRPPLLKAGGGPHLAQGYRVTDPVGR